MGMGLSTTNPASCIHQCLCLKLSMQEDPMMTRQVIVSYTVMGMITDPITIDPITSWHLLLQDTWLVGIQDMRLGFEYTPKTTYSNSLGRSNTYTAQKQLFRNVVPISSSSETSSWCSRPAGWSLIFHWPMILGAIPTIPCLFNFHCGI